MKKIIHDNDFDLVSLPIGSREKVFYRKDLDSHGNSIFTERRRVDINQDIQSYKDGCILSILLNRLSMASADQIISACTQVQTIGADVSVMPSDLVSAFTALDNLEAKCPGIKNEIGSGKPISEIIAKYFNNSNVTPQEDISNGTI